MKSVSVGAPDRCTSGPTLGGVDPDEQQRALDRAAALVGDRWTLLIVHALLAGPARFSDLEQRVGGISPNALTSRLRTLEDDGIVLARPYQLRPMRHAYELSDRGAELAGVLRLLAAWADPDVHADVHAVCGTQLEVAHWCPTCQLPAGAPGDEGLIEL